MNERDKDKQLDKLMSAFDGLVSEMSDEELAERIRSRGESPEQNANKLKYLVSSNLKRFGLDKKSRARLRYEESLNNYKGYTKQSLPASPSERRELFFSLLASPEGAGAATAQFRQLSFLNEFDVENMLGKLQFLAKESGEIKISEEPESINLPDVSEIYQPELNYSSSSSSAFYKSPDQLLEQLEITEPGEIDVEAIAYHQGALVIYETLIKCEAFTLSNNANRAVIVVNDKSPQLRQRFSVAHELGHWMRDRNISAFCDKKAYADHWYGSGRETLANQYAKELLLPKSMFAPLAKNLSVNLESVRNLAKTFKTSLTATALRLVELGSYPAVIVFSKFPRYSSGEPGQRIWYVRGTGTTTNIHPRSQMSAEALAYEICIDDEKHEVSGEIEASAWFDHPQASGLMIQESSIRIDCNKILTLLSWDYDDGWKDSNYSD